MMNLKSNWIRLQIAKEQVISLDHVADGIRGLRLAFVNVFAVTHLDSSWTLVDAGLPCLRPA